MSGLYRAIALTLVVATSISLGAEEPAHEPHDGVLVLRNGSVLQGRITSINDIYLVTVGADNEVRLPRAEVEFQCRDLDDAYLQQRDALVSDDASTHLRLAEWCLRQGLLSRAADQLLVAFIQAPTNPRLRILEQRLLSLGTKPVETIAESKPPVEHALPLPPPRSKLSPQMMQQFSTVIQPILFNRCATHTCHGNGGSTRFRLIRPALGHSATSRMTQRNLQAMQSFMDHEHPEKSPVLVQGNVAHGGSENPPFVDKQIHQLELLEAWVRRAAVAPAATIVTNSGGPNRARGPTSKSKSPVAPAGFDSASDSKSAVVPAAHVDSPPPANPPPTADPIEGRDPFDPEIFNRRYHSAAPK